MRNVVIFPAGSEASADAYLAFCNAHNPDGGEWYPPDRVDGEGRRVVAYLGPAGFQYDGAPFPEPEGGPAARSAGTLSDTVEWPSETWS